MTVLVLVVVFRNTLEEGPVSTLDVKSLKGICVWTVVLRFLILGVSVLQGISFLGLAPFRVGTVLVEIDGFVAMGSVVSVLYSLAIRSGRSALIGIKNVVPGPMTHFEVEGMGMYDNVTSSEVLEGFGAMDSVAGVLSFVSI